MLGLAASADAQRAPGTPDVPHPSGFPEAALRSATKAELAKVRIVRDVVYGHKDGLAMTYDVFRPKKPNGALVINIVSGGWRSEWAAPEHRLPRYTLLTDKGFTVVSLRHGSATRYNVVDATADVRRATRFIKLHAKDYGCEPARIGVWGASAGGHLALVAGLMADDGDKAAADPVLQQGNRLRAVVAYFPPADLAGLMKGQTRPSPLNITEAEAAAVSPIRFVDPHDPPTLILQGDADPVVVPAQAEALHAALEKAGVESKLQMFAGAEHDFNMPSDPVRADAYATQALQAMVAWFETHLKK
jgi:acetyl esterase/lipase